MKQRDALAVLDGIAAVLVLVPRLIDAAERLQRVQLDDPEVSDETLADGFARLDAAIEAARERLG